MLNLYIFVTLLPALVVHLRAGLPVARATLRRCIGGSLVRSPLHAGQA